MTDEKKEKLGFTPDGWAQFMSHIAEKFGDGKLISHEWLKEQFGLKKLRPEDYESLDEFLWAIENQKISYMKVVDAVRWDLLEQEKMYIANVRSEGYRVLPPEDQTSYGYEKFTDDIKKAIRQAGAIMNCVLPVDQSQQRMDNDLRAKFGIMKQMLNSIKY